MTKKWFTIKKVYPGIYALAEFGHFEEIISYLITGKKKALLFDTGMGIGNIFEEVHKLTSLPITVINSHTHFDHIGENYKFKDVLLFKNEFAKQKAVKGYSHSYMLKHIQKKTFNQSPPNSFNSKKFSVPPFIWIKTIKNHQIIDVSPFQFRLLHTPGHSPDSICLYEEKKGILFTGDTIYPGPIYLQQKESNFADYKKSIDLLSSLHKIKKVFPSHNRVSQSAKIVQKIRKKLSATIPKKTTKIHIDKDTSVLI